MVQTSHHRNRWIVFGLLAIVIGMSGLTYASAKFYNVLCRVTGFGGIPQQTNSVAATIASQHIVNRTIHIRLNADIDQNLPWLFKPEVKEISLKLGQQGMVSFRAENHSSQALIGSAVYNITPEKAAPYFNKIQCFCFQEQHLNAGQKVDMPVVFFVDPDLAKDHNLDDIDTITLSYTFFRAKG